MGKIVLPDPTGSRGEPPPLTREADPVGLLGLRLFKKSTTVKGNFMSTVRTIDTRLGLGKESVFGTPVAPTLFLDYVENNLGLQSFDDIDLSGTNGARGHHSNHLAAGVKNCGGTTSFYCRPNWLELLLEGIAGGSVTGTSVKTYHLGNSNPSFTLESDLKEKVLTLSGAKIQRAVFESSVNRALSLTLDWLAKDIAIGTSATSGTASNSKTAFLHHQSSLSWNNATIWLSKVRLTIDNGLVEDDFCNAQTRREILETDRTVSGSFLCKWSGEHKAIFEDYASSTPRALVLSYTAGADTLTFTMNNVRVKCATPASSARGLLYFPCAFVALRTDASDEVVITLTTQ
jgi:hypothetical protein